MRIDDDMFVEWVEEAYRQVVADAQDSGIKRQEAIELVSPMIAADIDNGDLVLPADVVERLVGLIIERGDNQRRRKQPEQIAYVVEIINGGTILGKDNPVLDQVCVIGDGVRRAWRHVGIEDIMEMAQRRVKMSADAARAADEFMTHAVVVTGYLLRTYGASAVIGDLA